MNEKLIQIIRSYVLLVIKNNKGKTKSNISDKQAELFKESERYCDDTFTVANLKDLVLSIIDGIDDKYFNVQVLEDVLQYLGDYITENKIQNKDKLLSNLSPVWEYLGTKLDNYTVKNVTFTLREIYAESIEDMLSNAYDKSIERIKEDILVNNFKQAQSDDVKQKEKNAQLAGEEISKQMKPEDSVMAVNTTLMGVYANVERYAKIQTITELLTKLSDSNVKDDEKNAIVATLAGNTESIQVFVSKYFISSYVSYLYMNMRKNSSFLSELRSQGYPHIADLISNTSIRGSIEYIISTAASCMKNTDNVPEEEEDVYAAIVKLKQFSFNRQDLKFKQKKRQKLIFNDEEFEDRRSEEEKEKDARLIREQIAEIEAAKQKFGGEEGYNKYLRSLNEGKKLKKILTLTGNDVDVEEAENCHNKDDYFDCKDDLSEVLSDIMDYYKVMFDLCIKMNRFSGIYMFKDAQNDECGMLEVAQTNVDGAVTLRTKNFTGSKLFKWLNLDYDYPIRDTLKVARGNKVPNLENILVNGYNYFPLFIARYALGFVRKQKYKNFDKFIKALTDDVENRLYAIYHDKVTVDGKEISGATLFDASNSDRVKLIGAFVNSVIFLTGSSVDKFNASQFRCVSAIRHSNTDAKYYTTCGGDKDKKLADAVTASFLEVNNSYTENVLDVTYIKDKKAFYGDVSWAYQELGNVYGTGDVPQVKFGESVIIGQTLSGNLVEFTLGDNKQFTTSIYAGSRSGKGVTTLSILAAIMASKIGICYLDCKPDMVNCFWDMESKASRYGLSGLTYAYDINAGIDRLGRTPMKSLTEQLKSGSALKKTSLASSLMLLKHLQMLAITGQYKQQVKKDSSLLVWVFDEINNMTAKLEGGYGVVIDVAKDKKASAEDKDYALKIMDFWRRLHDAMSRGISDTWGQCGYKFICIGQKPQDIMTSMGVSRALARDKQKASDGAQLLQLIANAPVNKYILGRGVNVNGGFGSKAYLNVAGKEERDSLEEYRYFIMRDVAQVNANSNDGDSSAVLFKPFLTLNFDDVLHSCWRGGVAASHYAKVTATKGTTEYNQQIQMYKKEMNAAYGINTELREDVLNDANEGHGVVDEGTGFYGLVKMYLKGNDKDVLSTAVKPYLDFTDLLTEMHIIGAESMYGYENIEDFLFDFSPKGMEITGYEEWQEANAAFEKSGGLSRIGADGSTEGQIKSDYSIPTEEDATPKNSNSQEENLRVKQETEEALRQKQAEEEQAKAVKAKLTGLRVYAEKLVAVENLLSEIREYINTSEVSDIDTSKVNSYIKELQGSKAIVAQIKSDIDADDYSIFSKTTEATQVFNGFINRIQDDAGYIDDYIYKLGQLLEQLALISVEDNQDAVDEVDDRYKESLAEDFVKDIDLSKMSVEDSENIFTTSEDISMDLRNVYINNDELTDKLNEFKHIYEDLGDLVTKLKEQISSGVYEEQIISLKKKILQFKENVQEFWVHLETKYNRIDELKSKISNSGLDNASDEVKDKYEKLTSYYSGYRDTSETVDYLLRESDTLLEIVEENSEMAGYVCTFKDSIKELQNYMSKIKTLKFNGSAALIEEALINLDNKMAVLVSQYNTLKNNIDKKIEADYKNVLADYEVLKDELNGAKEKAANASSSDSIVELPDVTEASTFNLQKSEDSDESGDFESSDENSSNSGSIGNSGESVKISSTVNTGKVAGASSLDDIDKLITASDEHIDKLSNEKFSLEKSLSDISEKEQAQTSQAQTSQTQESQEQTSKAQTSKAQTSQAQTSQEQKGQEQKGQTQQAQKQQVVKKQADPSVRIQQGSEACVSHVDSNGNVTTNTCGYLESTITDALTELDDRLTRPSRFKFVDNAMVNKNIKARYKLFVKSVEDTIGWAKVTRLEMTASNIIFNKTISMSVETIGGEMGFNFYDVANFSDLLFKHASRLITFIVDKEVSEILVAECGGDVYEMMFNSIPTLSRISIDGKVVSKHNRDYTQQLALKQEVEKEKKKTTAKNAFAESLFASGEVKKTSKNIARANKITRRAEKSGRKTQTNKGILAAQKLGQMTLPQLFLGGIAGTFLLIGSGIRKVTGR
jgi:hypothetical protein